jgi:hypothetical protein
MNDEVLTARPVRRPADVVDCPDVRMVERRRGARLTLESINGGRVAAERRRQKRQGNFPPQPRVFRLVDDAMPPPPSFSGMQ